MKLGKNKRSLRDMKKQNINISNPFPSIDSFEEYEVFKKKTVILESMAKKIIQQHSLSEGPLILYSEGTNIVFAYGQHRVIKIFPSFHYDQFKSELLVLKHFESKLSVKTPVLEYEGNIAGWSYLVMSQLHGTLLEELWEKINHDNKIIIMHELGLLIREVHSLPTQGLQEIDCHWQTFIAKQINACVERHRSLQLPASLLEKIQEYLTSITPALLHIRKPVILTGEYTPMNFLVKQIDGIWHIDGLIDFGDAMLGLPEYDLLGPGAFLIQGDKRLLKEFLISYGYESSALTTELSHQLTALMLLHRYSNLNVQIRIKDWQSKVHSMKDLQNLVWGF